MEFIAKKNYVDNEIEDNLILKEMNIGWSG
jgi:hypothetical protein